MRKKYWLAVALLFVFAVVLVIAIPILLPPTPGVTYVNYGRIEQGMTRSQVEALFGEPRRSWDFRGQKTGRTLISTWVTESGDRVMIDFDENDHVAMATWNYWKDNRTGLEKLRDRIPWLAKEPPPPYLW